MKLAELASAVEDEYVKHRVTLNLAAEMDPDSLHWVKVLKHDLVFLRSEDFERLMKGPKAWGLRMKELR